MVEYIYAEVLSPLVVFYLIWCHIKKKIMFWLDTKFMLPVPQAGEFTLSFDWFHKSEYGLYEYFNLELNINFKDSCK